MSKLGDAKTIGGVGSILLFIPGVNIIGYILILVAGKWVSDAVGDKSIFDHMLYAVITGIVGAVAAVFIIFSGAIFGVFTLGIGAILGLLVGLAVAWIAFIISSIFIRQAYDKMAAKLGVGSFKTAGMLYFIGSILIIILVGFIILFVADIFQIIAFFSIPEAGPGMGMAGMQARPTVIPVGQEGTKYCASCGNPLPVSATFCGKCGAKQPS